MKKGRKRNLSEIIEIKEEMQEKGYDYIFKRVLSPENQEMFCHRLEEHQEEFLKIEEYSECNQKLSELLEQIENIEDPKVKEIVKEYAHQLNIQSEYDICLASAIALRDGILIGLIE